MTGALSCARCGAPLPSAAAHVATTCPFCGATAAPAPKVIEREVERVVVLARGGEGALRCPRCAAELREARSGETLLRACGECGGLWLRKADVERLEATRDPDLETAALRLVGLVLRPTPNRRPRIACPECAEPLRRIEIDGMVEFLDVCDAHGTWFDRDELPAFVSVFTERRAGAIEDDDLRAAGLPGGTTGGGGFFTDLFRSVRRLMG